VKRFRFIIKRLLSMIVIMFLVSFLVFVVLRMSDADPLTVMIGNNQSTPELRQALTEKYHLDDPVHIDIPMIYPVATTTAILKISHFIFYI